MNESTPRAAPSDLAPVVLFAYRRPDHLRRTVTSLLDNAEAAATHVTVYCDAPKRPEHREGVEKARNYVKSISGFASVTRVFRGENMGSARSIIQGVTDTLRIHKSVIVVEDDLVLSPHFLRYMNDGLACYQGDEQVASIHGYWYPTDASLPETFFLRGADCWGWATWSRAWRHFESDGKRLLRDIRERKLSREFDYDGSYPHMRILKRCINGRNDSWCIRWHGSCYLKNMLTLYPSRTLVDNIGHDNSGTHCGISDVFSSELATDHVVVHRSEMIASERARRAAIDFFRKTRESTFQKLLKRLRHRIGLRLHAGDLGRRAAMP